MLKVLRNPYCLASPLGDSKGLEPFQSPGIGEDGLILFRPLLL